MKYPRWEVKPPASADFFHALAPLPPLIAQLLYNREIRSPSEAQRFLFGTGAELHDPFLLPGMERAVARIRLALRNHEAIAIYGDYDADGVTSAAVLSETLTRLGAQPHVYLPHREREGYGLRLDALATLYRNGVRLVITVDCGIGAVEEVQYASQLGLDVIVTDHHTVPPDRAPALAVVNPKLSDSQYPFAHLAGVGVAYKLAQGLLEQAGASTWGDGLLDLVAIGTIADMAPLLGENRLLVRRGLALLNAGHRPGLKALSEGSGAKLGSLDAEKVAFTLAPRLNASGRMADARVSYELLLAQDEAEAAERAQQLEQHNTDRQRSTASAVELARTIVAPKLPEAPVLVVHHSEFPLGVLGLVASRLVDEYARPAVVIRDGSDECRGSARSIPGLNITTALAECRELLLRYGGHAQAAGFSVIPEQLPALERRLTGVISPQLEGKELSPILHLDAQIRLTRLEGETIRKLDLLEPHGAGNPKPAFVSRGLEVRERRTVGNGENHLLLTLHDGRTTWRGFAFEFGPPRGRELPSKLDVAFSFEKDPQIERELLRLRIKDLRPSTSPA